MPNMTAPNQSNRDRYECDARCTAETDMSETLEPEFAVIRLRRLDPILHRYDWDAPNFFDRYFWVCRSLKCVESKSKNKIFFGRLSHITANSGSSVSIISVSAVHLASHSYRSHLAHFDAVILGIPLYNGTMQNRFLRLDTFFYLSCIWWHDGRY